MSWITLDVAAATEKVRPMHLDLTKFVSALSIGASENHTTVIRWYDGSTKTLHISVQDTGGFVKEILVSDGKDAIRVSIELFVLPPRLRGLGLGAKSVAHMVRLLKSAAKKAGKPVIVSLEAGLTDGGYFWAARGWSPIQSSIKELVEQIEDRFAELRDEGRFFPVQVEETVLKYARSGDLAGLVSWNDSLAKLILRGLYWHGELVIQ